MLKLLNCTNKRWGEKQGPPPSKKNHPGCVTFETSFDLKVLPFRLTAPLKQHSDRFLQKLAELSQPLGPDRTIHHPVITAEGHRHHVGHIEPRKNYKYRNIALKYFIKHNYI